MCPRITHGDSFYFFRRRRVAAAIIAHAISHFAIIVDASKFTQFRPARRAELSKRSYLARTERCRRLRKAKNELFNWASLISRVSSNYTVSRSVSVRQLFPPDPPLALARAPPRPPLFISLPPLAGIALRTSFHSSSFLRGSWLTIFTQFHSADKREYIL